MIEPSQYPTCVYCGDLREALDHVLPQSKNIMIEANPQLGIQAILVACCNMCNSIAGDKVFATFDAKALYINTVRIEKGLPFNHEAVTKTLPMLRSYMSARHHSVPEFNSNDPYIVRSRGRRPTDKICVDGVWMTDESELTSLAGINGRCHKCAINPRKAYPRMKPGQILCYSCEEWVRENIELKIEEY